MTKISIVTISYNQSPFLRECIESVLSQEKAHYEYIVVDPGSTDGSRDIVESYGNRIIRVFEPDAGPADGLNNGFIRATGDVYGFINADDYLLPGALSSVTQFFEKNGLDVFMSGRGYIDDNNGRARVTPSVMRLMPVVYGACTIFQQSTFFPAKLFRHVNGFNSTNHTCWDGELFTDFLAAGFKHHTIDPELAVFRMHEASISGSGRMIHEYLDERKRIFNKVLGRVYTKRDIPAKYYWRIREQLARIFNR